MPKQQKVSRWYFGGVASAMACCCTHPLDLLKVHLQTQEKPPFSVFKVTAKIVKTQGAAALYKGLSAALVRQVAYSTTRFGIYEGAKQKMGKNSGFFATVGLAAFAGAAGGFLGTPGDKINVRMQYDVKLPMEKRLNYKHAFHGLWRVYKEEGFTKIFSGGTSATVRAAMMTVCQLSFYDQIKQLLIKTPYFKDDLTTHFTASLAAGAIATGVTEPLDVLKTKTMAAKPEDYKGMWNLFKNTAKMGPMTFFHGYVPAFMRLAPQTILTFLFLEQLKGNFGIVPTVTISNVA